MTADERSVQAHYRTEGLLDRILAGLRAAGMDPEAPTVDDLAPADEFHSLGRVATKDLAELAALKPGTRVLDVGSGLGGPARFLATTYSCDVTGIDLMPEFCTVATELSRLTRLTERTRFRQGNALALPFDEGTFDYVWTIQTQMNIAAKRQFYGEIMRVLRPRRAIHIPRHLCGQWAAAGFSRSLGERSGAEPLDSPGRPAEALGSIGP